MRDKVLFLHQLLAAQEAPPQSLCLRLAVFHQICQNFATSIIQYKQMSSKQFWPLADFLFISHVQVNAFSKMIFKPLNPDPLSLPHPCNWPLGRNMTGNGITHPSIPRSQSRGKNYPALAGSRVQSVKSCYQEPTDNLNVRFHFIKYSET